METGRTAVRHRGVRAIALAVLATLALASVLTGCGTMDAGDQTASDGMAAPYPGEDFALTEEEAAVGAADTRSTSGSDASSIPAEDRLIIRNKSIRMQVEDVRETVQEIRDIADTAKAIVTNVNVASNDGPVYRYDEYGSSVGSGEALSGWITVRVPTANYDAFVDDVSGLGEILWEGESSDDVTQEHVDLSARLANLEAEEARLREFFDAANEVEEMLSIERELGRVRGDIESLSAQIAYLERQAAMATVTIELSEPEAIVQPDGPDWGFRSAITAGLQLAANVVKAAIVALLGALPLLIVGGIAFLIIRAVVKARRRRAVSASEIPVPGEADQAPDAQDRSNRENA